MAKKKKHPESADDPRPGYPSGQSPSDATLPQDPHQAAPSASAGSAGDSWPADSDIELDPTIMEGDMTVNFDHLVDHTGTFDPNTADWRKSLRMEDAEEESSDVGTLPLHGSSADSADSSSSSGRPRGSDSVKRLVRNAFEIGIESGTGTGSGSGTGLSRRRDRSLRLPGEVPTIELKQLPPVRKVVFPEISADLKGPTALEPVDQSMDADYQVIGFLGRGTYGIVFEATQLALDRSVALKVLTAKPTVDLTGHSDSQGTKSAAESVYAKQQAKVYQFLYEANITSQLAHPNIIPVFDVAMNEDGDYFYAMKKMEDKPWSRSLREAGKSAEQLEENIERFRAVCDAMAYAHSRGIVHRDLKPANVMLGDFNEVTVVDWGLAVDLKRSHLDLSPGGTAAYMAPEMALHFLHCRRRISSTQLLSFVEEDPANWDGNQVTAFDRRCKVFGANLAAVSIEERAAHVYQTIDKAFNWDTSGLVGAERQQALCDQLAAEIQKSHRLERQYTKKISTSSDVYVLGAILYEIAMGHPPHQAPNNQASLALSAHHRFQVFEKVNDPLRKTLVEIALQAMRYKPSDRYASVEKLMEALQSFRDQFQSNRLTERGQKELELAKAGQGYDHLVAAMESFREANELWKANPEARQLQDEAAELYARRALGRRDYDAGLSILDAYHLGHNTKSKENANALVRRLNQGKRNRNRMRTLAVVGWALVLIALPVAFIAAGYFVAPIVQEANAKIAEAAASIAQANKDVEAAQTTAVEEVAKAAERIKTEQDRANKEILAVKTQSEKEIADARNDAQAEIIAAREAAEADIAQAKMEAEVEAAMLVAQAKEQATKQIQEAEAVAVRQIKEAEEMRIAAVANARQQIAAAELEVQKNQFDSHLGRAERLIINSRRLRERNELRELESMLEEMRQALPISFSWGFEGQLQRMAQQRSAIYQPAPEPSNESLDRTRQLLRPSLGGDLLALGSNPQQPLRIMVADREVSIDGANLGSDYIHAAVSPDGRWLALTYGAAPHLILVNTQTGDRVDDLVAAEEQRRLQEIGFVHFSASTEEDSSWRLWTVDKLRFDILTEGRLQLSERWVSRESGQLTSPDSHQSHRLDIGNDGGDGSFRYHVVVQSSDPARLVVVAEDSVRRTAVYKGLDLPNDAAPVDSDILHGGINLSFPGQQFPSTMAMMADGQGEFLFAGFTAGDAGDQDLSRQVWQAYRLRNSENGFGLFSSLDTLTGRIRKIETAAAAYPLVTAEDNGLVRLWGYEAGRWVVKRTLRGLEPDSNYFLDWAWDGTANHVLWTADKIASRRRWELDQPAEDLRPALPIDRGTEQITAMARDGQVGSAALAMGTSTGRILIYDSDGMLNERGPIQIVPAPTPHLSRRFRDLNGVGWAAGYVVLYSELDASLELVGLGQVAGERFPAPVDSPRVAGFMPRLDAAVDAEGRLVAVTNHPAAADQLIVWWFDVESSTPRLLRSEVTTLPSEIREFALSPNAESLAVIRRFFAEVTAGSNYSAGTSRLTLELATLASPSVDSSIGPWNPLWSDFRSADPFVAFAADGQSVMASGVSGPRYGRPRTNVTVWSRVDDKWQVLGRENIQLTPESDSLAWADRLWTLFDWNVDSGPAGSVYALGKGRRYFVSMIGLTTDSESPIALVPQQPLVGRKVSLIGPREMAILNLNGEQLELHEILEGSDQGRELTTQSSVRFDNATDIRRFGRSLLVLDQTGLHVAVEADVPMELQLAFGRQVACVDLQLNGDILVASYDNNSSRVFHRIAGGPSFAEVMELRADSMIDSPRISGDARWLSHLDSEGNLSILDVRQPRVPFQTIPKTAAGQGDLLTHAWVGAEDSHLLLGRIDEQKNIVWQLWDPSQAAPREANLPDWVAHLPPSLPEDHGAWERCFVELAPQSQQFLSVLLWNDGKTDAHLYVWSVYDLDDESKSNGVDRRWLRSNADAPLPERVVGIFPNPAAISFSELGPPVEPGQPTAVATRLLAMTRRADVTSLRYFGLFADRVVVELANRETEEIQGHPGDAATENVVIHQLRIADWSNLLEQVGNPTQASFSSDGRLLYQLDQEGAINIMNALPINNLAD